MTLFERQKIEIKRLNNSKKIRRLLREELGVRPDKWYLSNPDNFKENTFYHYTNSLHDKRQILKNGFDVNKVKKRNQGIGRGLYLGRDKETLMRFYDASLIGDENCIITIIGTLNFLSLLSEAKLQRFLKKARKMFPDDSDCIEKYTTELGYDGIRYYDYLATGEEFVLFDLSAITKIGEEVHAIVK